MKTYFKFFLLVLIPQLIIAQEFNTIPFVQHTSNIKKAHSDLVNNKIKKRFESLATLAQFNRNLNYQGAEKSILKQISAILFNVYITFNTL